jgi:pyruvate dehydrogenase E2 component (dihydrolipoamide acetyltransferase)
VLVEVNTAKALVEIPSPWPGVVERLHAAEGAVVNVGEPLVSIVVDAPSGGASEAGSTASAPDEPRRRAVLVGYGVDEDESAFVAPSVSSAAAVERGAPVAATPPVRRLAKELGVDLATVTPSGPDGRVTRDDVLKASEALVAPASPVEPTSADSEAEPASSPDRADIAASPDGETDGARRVPVRGTRRLIAEKMTRSIREIPQVTTFLTVDCSHLLAYRDRLVAETGERISPLAIIVAALVRTIGAHPKLNASFDAQGQPGGGPEMVLFSAVHVGIATDTPNGLLVPVVKDAARLGIGELAEEIRRLASSTREGRATLPELTGSTITVSNVGTFGAEFGTPIINHPEGAILAIGVIEPRALVVGGSRVEARPAAVLSLTFDHRLMDGAEAGRALRALANLIGDPSELESLPR